MNCNMCFCNLSYSYLKSSHLLHLKLFIQYNLFVIYKTVNQMIDLDMMPPDWAFAAEHAKATKPGIVDNLHTGTTASIFCPCCLKPIIKTQIPLCSNSKQLQFLGFGFPLYFIFLKYCIVLILILIMSYSTLSLYWGIQNNQDYCAHRRLSGSEEDMHCSSIIIMFSRIEHEVTKQELVLRIASYIAHLLALIYIRDSVRKTIQYYDQKTTSLSDFCIVIKNLPLKAGIQKNINQFIHYNFAQKWQQLKNTYNQNEFQQQKKVMQITLLPDLKDYYSLTEQKKSLIQEKRSIYIQLQKQDKGTANNNKVINTQRNIQQQIDLVNKQIYLHNQKISAKCQQYRLLACQDKLQSHIAIVTLNSQMFKNTLIQHARQNKLSENQVGKYFGQFQGQLSIQQSPQPNQIIWKNVNIHQQQRRIRKLMGWGLSLLFITGITVGFYFLVVLKTKNLIDAIQRNLTVTSLHQDSNYKVAVFLVYLFLFLIVLFNKFVLGFVLHYFTHMENHQNTSDQQFSFAIKYTIGMFFTTAIMTLAVQDITFHNFYSHEFGVIEEQSIMFFINAFFVPIIWLINPWQIKTLILRKFRKNKKYYTQGQANQIMSDSQYVMGKRYAEVIQTMWFTFLYSSLVPFGAFITFFGLCIYYWGDKINLLRRSSLSHNVSGSMTLLSLKLLDVTLMLRPLGTMIFDWQIRDGVNVSQVVFVSIGIVYLFLPMDKILEFFHQQKFKQEQSSYADVKDTFLETYQTLNPILRSKGHKVIDRMRKRLTKQISFRSIQSSQFINTEPRLSPIKRTTLMMVGNLNQSLDIIQKTEAALDDKNDVPSVQQDLIQKSQ